MAVDEYQKPHFALLPFMAQGHMIPMVDIARLLAKRGATVTILTTPHNSKRFENVIGRAIGSQLKVRVVHLKFPCVEAGLSEGCENFDMLPSMEDATKFFVAIGMLKDQVREIIEGLEPRVNCLIADMCFTWASNLGQILHIPRLMFHGTSCFSLLCMYLLKSSKDFEAIASDFEYFVVPGLPDRIEITKAQIRGIVSPWDPKWNEIRDQMRQAEDEAFGTVINTFHDLEPEYVKEYMKVRDGKKLWSIGPVSLCNKDGLDIAERGNKASINGDECLKWLDSQGKASVIYVCLGSLSRISSSQLMELGLALRASNRPFIWVIRNASDELKARMFDEKLNGGDTNGRGFLIHGWAPQVMILSHPSVGGFLTHCGWNSTLEGITAGLPMITWPVFADQFCNEKFIVHVIKTGIRVGVELPILLGEEEKVGVLVKNDDIKTVIDELMNGGEEGEERRKRARELGEMARRATEGGSSSKNIELLIQDVALYQDNETIPSASGAVFDHEKYDKIVVQEKENVELGP